MVSRYQKRISRPLLDRADLRSDNIHKRLFWLEGPISERMKAFGQDICWKLQSCFVSPSRVIVAINAR